ncbi:hypothetical protein [Maritimibacter sp. HL-12]|jgi:hypothetical protein|uniref:hypothetical protein n=1 Tax=Maritimibacter sp. HL-12 TaxID=1162418 RepID=UPI000A0EF8CB|nr:hypothetical protein [Maritimibacter sp. HL-12]SMH48067.1 hypothetical protein SAMN05661107_1945 [Maritimibacter sp. HL-12]
MAATMTLRKPAKVLPFGKPCQSVTATDRDERLPRLTSAEIESFFDQAKTARLLRQVA